MAKFKDENGEEVEALTEEEVNAKVEAEKATIIAEMEQKIAEQKTQFEAEKLEIENKLSGLSDKDKNFSVLKAALDEKTNQIKELGSKIEEESKKVRLEIVRDDLVTKLSRGDKELEKKIRLNFDETLKSVKAETKEEIESKIQSAYKLSVDSSGPNPLDIAMMGGAGRGFVPGKDSNGAIEFSEGEKLLGKNLGISDDDYKKYENDPRLKKASGIK